MAEDPITRVIPDKIRHLEARVARLEDSIGMIQKDERRKILGMTSTESKTLLGIVAACSLGIIILKIRTKENHV